MRTTGRSEDTITRRIGTCRRFLAHAQIDDMTIAEPGDVEDFLRQFRSPATRAAYLGDLRAYYAWAKRRRLMTEVPTDRIDAVSVPQAMPRPLTAEELMRAVATAEQRLRVVLLLGALAGLRRQEIAAVHGEDVGDGRLRVRRPKGSRQRIVPVHPVLQVELDAYGVRRGPLFPRPDAPDTPVSRDRIGYWVQRHFEQLGIEGGCHRLRHSAATALAVASQDPYVVATFLGHQSIEMSRIYVEVTSSRVADHVARMPDPRQSAG